MKRFVYNNFLLCILSLTGLNSLSQSSVLDHYIDSGLIHNTVIQQKQIALQQAMLGLEQAKAMYKPSIDFLGSFQDGGGGRSISLPIGDLMNPVYSTLNQLTSSNKFLPISNVENYFLPQQFTDLKFQAVVPIYNTNLAFNKAIRTQQVALQETEVDLYRRSLVNDLKQAYYQYLMSEEAIHIYETARGLAEEGLRVNQKLLAAGKGLPAYVSRAEAEVEQLKAQCNEAEKQSENAMAYFNFLLNRNRDASIDKNLEITTALTAAIALLFNEQSVSEREELIMFKKSESIQNTVLQMNEAFAKPRLNAFANTGFQAERFNFGSHSSYYIIGLQLEVPLYKGKSNLLKIRQTQLDLEGIKSKTAETSRMLDLGTQVAKNRLQVAQVNYRSSLKQLESTDTYHRLIEKGFREGVNSFIETVDARSQLTISKLKLNLSIYKLLMAAAQLERELAVFNLKK